MAICFSGATLADVRFLFRTLVSGTKGVVYELVRMANMAAQQAAHQAAAAAAAAAQAAGGAAPAAGGVPGERPATAPAAPGVAPASTPATIPVMPQPLFSYGGRVAAPARGAERGSRLRHGVEARHMAWADPAPGLSR